MLVKNNLVNLENYPDILSVHHVREILGIGRTAVYRLLEEKQIRCFKIGNTYKIPKASVIEFVERSSKDGGRV